jgi:hypothetical protein
MWLLFFALSLELICWLPGDALAPRLPGFVGHRPVQSDAEFVALGFGCAPRVKPLAFRRLAGAETALFHYHRYFSGSQGPDGEPI